MITKTDIQRRYDIDWLRIGAVLLLFPFHIARIFNLNEDFYVKSATLSKGLSYFVNFMSPWHMQLLFLLAGASTWFALSHRGAGGYVGERVKRLFIPFIFGLLVIVPPQSFLGLASHGGVHGSYVSWFPSFFQVNDADPGGYFLGGMTFGHLWFIFHLFFYSIVALPVVLFLRRRTGRRVIDRLARIAARRGLILLFPFLLLPAAPVPEIWGGNPVYYGGIFLLGYLLMSDPRFERAIDRHKFPALLLGFIPAMAVAYLSVNGWPGLPEIPDGLAFFAKGCYYFFTTWFILIALLGYGRRLLSFSNRTLKYAAQASYPVYLLHQTVIVAVGFYAVKWQVGVPLRFAVILVGSVAATFLIYDLAVRRLNVLRFLFGMKMLREKPAAATRALDRVPAHPQPDGLRPAASRRLVQPRS